MSMPYAAAVRAPNFPPDLDWINAPPLTVPQLRGKLVILDFWTYCCINCMHIVPHLQTLEREFADELVVIGVHSAKFTEEQLTANVAAAVQRLEVHHPVVNDADHRIWDSYGVNAWPTLMFIDPHGRVYGKHAGEFDVEPVRQLLREQIAHFEAEDAIDRTPLPVAPLGEPSGILRFPGKVLADAESNRLFIADSGHHRVVVTDLAGSIQQTIGSGQEGLLDGDAAISRFRHPQGMALDRGSDTLYVADTSNHAIRAIDLASGDVRTVAGTGEQGYRSVTGPARETALSSPWDLVFHDGRLWIAMAGVHQLWTLDLAAGQVALGAGTGAESIHDGPLLEATFAQPSGITSLDGQLFIADSESSAIRRIDPHENRVRRLVGRGLFDFGDIDGGAERARLQHPIGICSTIEPAGPVIYIADTYNNKIKRLDPTMRTVETIAGGLPGQRNASFAEARFWEPAGLSLAGRHLYVADTNNHAIRRVDLDRGEVTTVDIGA